MLYQLSHVRVAGGTLPSARARLLASTLNGTGPIVFDEGTRCIRVGENGDLPVLDQALEVPPHGQPAVPGREGEGADEEVERLVGGAGRMTQPETSVLSAPDSPQTTLARFGSRAQLSALRAPLRP